MAIQYKWSKLRRKNVEVGRLYDDKFLYLEDDPGVWIQSNPDIVSSVRSLDLYLWNYKGESIGDSIGELSQLTHLSILGGWHLKCLPNTLSRLHHLHHLELNLCKKLEELPPNLGGLYNLKSLFLNHCDSLRWLPWSITKLSNLRILYLPEEFRLETLPPHLNDSIIISVEDTHIRKTWKELKTHVTETLSYQFPIIPEEFAAQKTSTPGYLQFEEGDPTLWIHDYTNYGFHSSLRVLDLDLGDWIYPGKIPDFIGELPQLTHLYISNGCLPHHLPPTFSRLTHLSLIDCTFEFDSLGKLSTLTSLHLCPGYHKLLPEHMDLPISLTHLTLQRFQSSIMASMGKLSNLNTLTLSHCGDLKSLPLHLNLTKLILRETTIKSLPIGLKHLEIIHFICRGKLCNKLEKCWRNQLVNLETLSYTCCHIESFSILPSLHNLRELQLKDCFSLQDLDKLVKLCTLDVSGTRIQFLPNSIINLNYLRRIILPKCFRLYTLPPDFENKVMISVDDTDESYYKYQGYHGRDYEIINDYGYMTSESIKEINEKFLEKFKQATVIEHASPHSPLNHLPDATRIIEGSQFNGSTDPTSNNNPNAFISSPNHEIENLPTSNEAGTIPVVVNECYSDVNANTMQVHVPKKFAAFNTDIPNFPYRNNIPAVIMDYLVGWNDVEADGNCGFRCVAEVFHGSQENWPMARQAILNELKAHPDVYQKIYLDDYSSTLQRIDWGGRRCGEEHYMEIVADLFPIANCYQCPVMCFTMTADGLNPQFSVTVFPWNVAAHSTRPTKELTIAHLGKCKHYILLDLKDDFPVPPVSTLWYGIKDETVDWDSQYATKRQRWDRLTNRSRDSTHLDVCDDESYYKHAGYYDSVYELSDDEDSINSNSTEDDTEIVAESRQEAIIEQASPHRPLNHPPDEIQILEDPTSNDNPNAFISSPNHEIKNLPTSNEAGTIPFVVDVSANTMPRHAPMEIEDKSNFPYHIPYHIKIPSAIMDYLVEYKDVEANGNCGFRCVAEVFHGGQENWLEARRAILNELKAHPNVYQKIYFDDYISALRRIDWDDGKCGKDHYMKIVADLFPIANFYQCIVMCFFVTVDELNPQLSATVLPWNIGAHSARPTKELSIAHLGERYKHYILLDLKDDFPVPPIPRLWYDIIGKTTVDWVSRYEERRKRWDQLTNRSRDSTHLVIRDDCNVNGGKSLVGENISHGHAIFNKEIEIQTLNSSRKGVVVTSVNLELAIGNAFAPALCKSQNSVKGGSNNHALVIGQHKKSQTGNVKHNNQRIEISRESINTLRSEGLTLEKAAEHFNVSRSTLKRRLREYEIKWPSGKKSKILDTNRKKRQHKESGRNLSQTNSVDPSNPTRQGQMELAGPSQLALSTLATLGQGMEHPIGQKHPTLSDFETIDSKDADPQQLEDFISQFGYIIINKSTEFHTYGHQRVEEPLNGDKAGRNLSGSQLMNNLVDPSNPTSHGQGMEHLAEPSQPALSNNPASHGQGVEHPNRQKEPTLSVLSGSTIDSKDVDRQDYEKLKNQLEDLIKPTECHQRVEEQLNIDKDKAGRNLPGSQLMINLVNPSNPSHGQGMEHLAEPSQPALFNRAIHGQGVEHLGGPSQPALFNPASHGQGVEHIAGSSQPTLSYHVPSEHNVVNNSTPDVVTTTVGEPPLSTQYCMDSHQHVEEHNGANEPAMVNTDLLPNESSSTFVVKATFNEDTAKFNFSLSSSIEELKDVVRKKLELEVGTFKIKYKDIDNDLVLMNDTSNLDEAVSLSRKSGSNVVRLSIFLKT